MAPTTHNAELCGVHKHRAQPTATLPPTLCLQRPDPRHWVLAPRCNLHRLLTPFLISQLTHRHTHTHPHTLTRTHTHTHTQTHSHTHTQTPTPTHAHAHT